MNTILQIAIKRTLKKGRVVILLLMQLGVIAQDTMLARHPVNTYSIQGWWGPPPPPFSPVVTADGRITFRIKAPKASAINLLFGEWNVTPQPMPKDSSGVWTITINPVPPGIYAYLFSVDGVQTLDFNNPVTKAGTQVYSSIVEVPGTPPRFDQLQQVPHGSLDIISYYAKGLQRMRSMYVYVPPQYFTNPQTSFPVLYLRHGGGDNESSWTQAAGRADVIVENLIAEGKAVPMIIVMTNGLTDGTWAGGSTPKAMNSLEGELLTEVLPLIEKRYKVRQEAAGRAIAGLSMGGGQAFVMGLRHTEKFAWVGEFSAGLLSTVDLNLDTLLPGIVNAQTLNPNLKLLWIGCGKADPRYIGHLDLIRTLQKRNIRYEFHDGSGGHEWSVWRAQLAGFAQKIFR